MSEVRSERIHRGNVQHRRQVSKPKKMDSGCVAVGTTNGGNQFESCHWQIVSLVNCDVENEAKEVENGPYKNTRKVYGTRSHTIKPFNFLHQTIFVRVSQKPRRKSVLRTI